jgi:hypothetical protein
VPLLGVLIYGIAEASTAYLITKITDPPPPPAESEGFAETQVAWKNQKEFLKLDLDHLDSLNTDEAEHDKKEFLKLDLDHLDSLNTDEAEHDKKQ